MNNIGEKRFAFVIMPFAAPFDSVYQKLIKPAVESCGIKCVRADEDSQGQIHGQMLQRIFESSVVVADISNLNANVFYELGVAHSSSCKTVVICELGSLAKVPFDIAPYRVLAYRHPGQVSAYFDEDSIQSLAAEISSVLADQSEGIRNPVQDYLISQSPIRSSNSLFINEFDAKSEEDLLSAATREMIYYGITANSFSDVLTGLIESNSRKEQLSIHVCLLDPEAVDCWEFLYQMREKIPADPTLFKEYMEEEIVTQRRAIRRLASLASKTDKLAVEVHLYSNPPLFWAYMVDQERIIVGHYALHRLNARNLPVNILVKGDRSTLHLFDYYHRVIELSAGRTEIQ
ncbi:MAG: hypothetical protein A2032_01855 [Chloroflexi bacterium RBG_19FT_COMBO_49_13]|nr:MAG: hypothetical protein A2Y53_08145 [Chloroflexi bacterium RBG_16_47_49]OGO60553.1 MAG: hypothetical protein A2032_01855 [Chloroflexi bacterium RBG_19FT_COMBO_49_13]